MQRARDTVLEAGGADLVNSFTRFYLALLGQISFDHCPAVPPEAVLLPTWFPINIYRISAWSRTILVPLSIIWSYRPVRQLEPQAGIRELFRNPPQQWPELRCPGLAYEQHWLSWERLFRGLDATLKWLDRYRLRPLRPWALKAAEQWMTQRFVASDGLGAIFPPIIWSLIALKCRGYMDDSAEVRYCDEQLHSLVIQNDDSARLQPCKSPVWDTALVLRALAGSGVKPHDPQIQQAVRWLLDKEVTRPGDWAQTVQCKPGGWFFEHHNEFYPDTDDTAMVLLALRQQFDSDVDMSTQQTADSSIVVLRVARNLVQARAQVATLQRVATAGRHAIRWLLAMQNRDGGWGAFDRDNNAEFLCRVPFADHNAMIDPSTPDLTGRVLESLGCWNYHVGHAAIDRGIEYLRQTQESDGSWPGRWGVNYIYGTWQVLAGLEAVGVSRDEPTVVQGANWLLNYQQPGGGWGESAGSYAQPSLRGRGPETASQTSWAVLGLLAAGLRHHPAVLRGIQYLLETQLPDGTWSENEFTGTGFPRVFYLRYHMYPVYFPLLALSKFRAAAGHHTH